MQKDEKRRAHKPIKGKNRNKRSDYLRISHFERGKRIFKVDLLSSISWSDCQKDHLLSVNKSIYEVFDPKKEIKCK